MEGWIKVHRQITNWGWYCDSNTFRLFIHLLLRANSDPREWKGYKILPGQLITGRKALSEELKLTEREIRTSITKLKTTNEIAIKTTNKFSIITVCKWEDYQLPKQAERPTERPANSPTSDQQTTTNKNIRIKERDNRVKFTQPTLAELESFFSEKINGKNLFLNPKIEAEKFDAFYGSKGWLIGKTKMTDWKKAVSGWIARSMHVPNTNIQQEPKEKTPKAI